MSASTAFLARLIGLYAVLVGLAMILQRDWMVFTVAALFRDPPALMLAGVIAVGVGLAIVLGHNVWSGNAVTIVVTVVGWLSLFKGLALLTFSLGSGTAYFAALHYAQYYYLYTSITLVLGAYLTYGSFASVKR